MNKGIVRFVLARMLIVEAGLMVLPVAVGLIYRESIRTIGSFLIVIAVLAILGILSGLKKPKSMKLYAKEGLVIASLSWIALSFFGSLPFFLSGEIPSLVDAFFEASSGFTTTGSSILKDIEILSRSILYWRSLTHLIGGMGVLVFALALLPNLSSNSVNLMKAEVPGPVFGKLVSKLRNSARILYIIYLAMTAALIVLLMFGGMDWYDASIHAFGAAGTGGFSVKNLSVGYYNSTYIYYVLSVAMLAFGLNFNLYYLLAVRQVRKAVKNEELRWYVAIVLVAVVLLCINAYGHYDSAGHLIRDVVFTVSSIITTTGYVVSDFNTWPLFSRTVLLLLMFVGACAGSTGGGLKVSRIGILIKTAIAEIRKSKEQRRVVSIKFDGSPLDTNVTRSVGRYFIVYVGVFLVIMLLLCLDVPDFLTAFSATAATFNNIGPGLEMVGPASNYADLSGFSKIILSIGMIAGRLELFPILVLFLPSTWRKRG